MIDSNKFLYWLTLEEGKPVKFAALVCLIAKALHPGDDEEGAFRAACVNLDVDLQRALQDGSLMVGTSSGLDRKRLAHSDTLQSVELIPGPDLESLLNARGIGLRLTPSVNDGPVYWTLKNAAIAIQKQEGWNDDARISFLEGLVNAAACKELVVRDPRTGLKLTSLVFLDAYHTVKPVDVNDCLEKQNEELRWTSHLGIRQPKPKTVADEKRWTPEMRAKLRAFRDTHTMKETSAHFGISEQRIRQLDPRKKRPAKGNSVFNM